MQAIDNKIYSVRDDVFILYGKRFQVNSFQFFAENFARVNAVQKILIFPPKVLVYFLKIFSSYLLN